MNNISLHNFNPEGSDLRKQQNIMLYMLDAFDQFCQKHNINYWLSSGTLLGAVRHEGFIPWDDDLDVEMLESDYKKLHKLLLTEEVADDILYQSSETDNSYVFPFPKLRYKHSKLVEKFDRPLNDGFDGIFIDIFILRKTNRKIAGYSNKMAWFFYRFSEKTKNLHGVKSSLDKVFQFVLFRLIFPFMYFFVKKKNNEDYGHIFGMPFFASKVRKYDDIFPLQRIKFETIMANVPANYDSMLRRIYGDYMQLPDLESIQERTHVVSIQIYKEK